MATGISFSCGTNSSLCFSGGICAITEDGRETCVCPPGYQHDFAWGHNSNCALPTWFLPAFFAITTVGIAWAVFYNLARAIPNLRKVSRRVGLLYMTALTMHWLTVLSVFVQNGNFEPGVIFLCLGGLSMAYMTYLVLFVLVEPIYAALRRPIEQFRLFMNCLFLAFSTAQTTFAVVMVIYCRNDAMFNAFYSGYLFVSSCFYLTPGMIVFVQTYRLEAMIMKVGMDPAQPGSEKMRVFLEQLHALRNVVLRMVFNFVIISIPIVMLTIGSMPYNFVFWTLQLSTLWPASRQAVKFMRGRSGQSSSRGPTVETLTSRNEPTLQGRSDEVRAADETA